MNSRVRVASRDYGLPVVVLIVLWVGFATTTPLFTGVASVFSVVEGFALVGLIAVGISVTVFAGELDLSTSSMAALAGVIAVRAAGHGLVVALILATVIGAMIGAIQGALIHRLAVDSLVFTIGSLIVLRGLAFMASHNATTPLKSLAVSDVLLKRWSFVSPDSIISLVAFALIGLYLTYTRLGRETYAVGGGRREAVSAGVPVGRVVVIAFLVSGACAALAGGLASIKGGSASPDSFGDTLLTAPAAILIGGVSLQNGRGTVLNVFLGVAILSVLTAGLGDRGVQAYTVNLAVGCLLVVVVVAQFLLERRSRSVDARPRQARWADNALTPPA